MAPCVPSQGCRCDLASGRPNALGRASESPASPSRVSPTAPRPGRLAHEPQIRACQGTDVVIFSRESLPPSRPPRGLSRALASQLCQEQNRTTGHLRARQITAPGVIARRTTLKAPAPWPHGPLCGPGSCLCALGLVICRRSSTNLLSWTLEGAFPGNIVGLCGEAQNRESLSMSEPSLEGVHGEPCCELVHTEPPGRRPHCA